MNTEEWAALGAILVLATLVRVPYVFQESVWNDEAVYMWLGESIIENPLFIFSQKIPRHSYGFLIGTMTAALSLFMSPFHASRLATLGISLVGMIGAYFLSREISNKWGGLAAAAILAVNPQYFFFSVRSLTDVYLAATLVWFAYAAVHFEGSKKSGILLGLATVLCMASRVTGVLVLPISALVMALDVVKHRQIREGVLWGGSILGALGLAVVGINWHYFGSPIQFGRASLEGKIFTGTHTYYLDAAGMIYTWPIFLLALVGVYFASSDTRTLPVAVAFAFYFLWFSLFLGEKVPRYVLQTVPLAVSLAMLTGKKLLDTFEIDGRALALMALVTLMTYPQASALVQQKSVTYSGFQELGDVAGQLDEQYNFDQVYAQSRRQIRIFSGIEYELDGGKVRPLPKSIENFTEGPILLQMDVWEYAGPDWSHPLSQETLDQLQELNFSIVHVVQRDYPTQTGTQTVPVGFLLVR